MLLIRTSKFPENAKPPFFAGYFSIIANPIQTRRLLFTVNTNHAPLQIFKKVRRHTSNKKHGTYFLYRNTSEKFHVRTTVWEVVKKN